MLNKMAAFLREEELIEPGDTVVCAVSGGADSVALLFGMYLLRDKLGFRLEAAHFNHHLRGEESDRDEAFVRRFCDRYDIPLTVGEGSIQSGKKGLEAAARDARYAFLSGLPGKIATAHTADDNAETVLMHMLRGTGLKGLGGIAPQRGRIIRPMLNVTRQDVEDFLEEYCLRHVEDSSNETDSFLRNRLRHHVIPLLKQENPSFAQSMTRMALQLRQDEELIRSMMQSWMPGVTELRQMPPALRSRYLERFLKESGIPEPEQSHLETAEGLVFSDKPSAKADFPGGIIIARNYDALERLDFRNTPTQAVLHCPGTTELPQWGIRVHCFPAENPMKTVGCFTVCPKGKLVIRSRQPGDRIQLMGGSKTLKKLMIDLKIPAAQRSRMPVLADEAGLIALCGVGADLDRVTDVLPAVMIRIEKTE